RRQDPERQKARAQEEETEIEAHAEKVGEGGRSRGDGEEREDAQRCQSHDPVPEPQARQANTLQNAQERRLVFERLQRDAIEDAEHHHRGNVILAERGEEIGRNEEPEQSREALRLNRVIADHRGLDRRNALRQRGEAGEGDRPGDEIKDPAALQEPPRLCGVERAETVQQRADEVRIYGRLKQSDIGETQRTQDRAALAEGDAGEDSKNASDQHPGGEIHGGAGTAANAGTTGATELAMATSSAATAG